MVPIDDPLPALVSGLWKVLSQTLPLTCFTKWTKGGLSYWCCCVIVKFVAMLTEASSATMYANTCGTRIFTTDSAPPQDRHRQRRVVVVVAVTGLSSTGVIRLPQLMHALIYTSQ